MMPSYTGEAQGRIVCVFSCANNDIILLVNCITPYLFLEQPFRSHTQLCSKVDPMTHRAVPYSVSEASQKFPDSVVSGEAL